jgi:hypothetical protein
VVSAIGSIAVDVQHRADGRRLVINASHCTAEELGAAVADLVRHDHECRADHTVSVDSRACLASPAKAPDEVRSVCIESPWGSRGSWRVELNFVEYPQQPYVEAYLPTCEAGALRVAALLLRGAPVPANYRSWR